MEESRHLPVSLKVVAWLFIITGILAVIEILAALAQYRISFNFGVLGLFVGPGLLRLSRGWRTCGLVLLWIAMALAVIIILVGLFYRGPATVSIFGVPVGHTSPIFMAFAAAALLGVCIWQYRVLTRPDIRTLFGLPSR